MPALTVSSPASSLATTAELSATELADTLERFLAEHPRAAVMEDGRVLFDMPGSRYALGTEHGRCVLQVWSEERNLVRTVTGLRVRANSLRLQVRRFGQIKTQSLHLIADRDTRTPSLRASARVRYLKLLEHMLPRAFGYWKLESLHSAMDLEHSFGPAYVRGLLVRGQSAWALIGVGADETQATIDGVLTLGLLWLHHCRERSGGKRVVEGLKVIVPAGAVELTRSRMAWLDPALAKWELHALDLATEELTELDTGRDGNLEMKLVQAFHPEQAKERFRASIERILGMVPVGARARVEVRPKHASEVSVSLHGLEFARVRHGFAAGSFARQDRISFGAGASETALTDENEGALRELVARLFASRYPAGDTRDPLFRLQPERWMESALRADLDAVEPGLRADCVYSQVPAMAAGDRGMLDLLSVTRGSRLAVLELKADEDLHMPLQGLDYWIRVHRIHEDRPTGSIEGGFDRAGYFAGQVLAPASPVLLFVAPALRVHPATEKVLQYLSPEIEWTLVAINEAWRSGPEVVWRKRGGGTRRPN